MSINRGDHICVKHKVFRDLVTHHGIYCGDGTVIHFHGDKINGNAEIRRDSLENFSHPFPVSEILVFERCPWGSADAVVKRAESCLRESGYNLFSNNCEHFASYCMTNKWKSSQAEKLSESSQDILLRAGQALQQTDTRKAMHEFAQSAAKTQKDPVKSALVYAGICVGYAAIGGLFTVGSYAVKKTSEMKSLRESQSPKK
jgi:hypothetical protein